jgi:hypothetical protein
MTRTERLRKLRNAVIAYRGITNQMPGSMKVKWLIPPNPHKRKNIVTWLTHLGCTHSEIEAHAVLIDGFQTRAAFDNWMRKLSGDEKEV